jgi:nucleoside-diphosphate-sugar epimerase
MSDLDESGASTPSSSQLVYFQSPRHLGPGLDSFTPSGFPATPVLHVSRHQHHVARSPLSLDASAEPECDPGSFPTGLLPRARAAMHERGSQIVLVVGCGGLVGTHVAAKLLSAGYSVRIFMLDTVSSEQLEALKSHARGSSKLFVFRGDQLDRAIEDCDFAVIAQLPRRVAKCTSPVKRPAMPSSREKLVEECVAELRDFFLCAKKFAKRLRRVVFISSAAAVFPVVEPVLQDAMEPAGRRVLLKEVERLALRAGIPLVSLLPSMVLGKAMSHEELSDFHNWLLRLASSWMPFVPKLRYNVVDVDDVAAAVPATLGSSAADGQRYLISGKEMSVREISAVLSGAPKWELPNVATLLLSVTGLLTGYTPSKSLNAFRYLQRNLDRRFPLKSEKYSRDLGLRTSDVEKAIIETVTAAEAAERSRPRRLSATAQPLHLESSVADGAGSSSNRDAGWSIQAKLVLLLSAVSAVIVGQKVLSSCFAALARRSR